MKLLSINTGEEESVRVESSERDACEPYSREGLRVESKPVQSSDVGPFSRLPEQTSKEHNVKRDLGVLR